MKQTISIIIDNREVTTDKSFTILECADKEGIIIPFLCNDKECNNQGGCMVCAVYDKVNNTFIPSCSVNVVQGMNIDASSEKIIEFRKTVLELLLSEHLGDCSAPCQRACPAGFDIPAFLDLINKNKKEQAQKMLEEKVLPCDTCSHRCEKACRRKQYDAPVPIFKIIMQNTGNNSSIKSSTKDMNKKEYSHSFGVINKQDLTEFVNTSTDKNGCLQCQCYGKNKCKLQKLATEFNARQHHFKAGKKISYQRIRAGNIMYEPGKCIRCGICSSISELNADSKGVSLQQRGWQTIPWVPLGQTWEDFLKDIGRTLVKKCPTGAFSFC